MTVRLRYEGFAGNDYGAVPARIVSVGEAARVHELRSVYRARARVVDAPGYLTDVPHGLPLTADLELATKSVWRWLADPVRSAWASL